MVSGSAETLVADIEYLRQIEEEGHEDDFWDEEYNRTYRRVVWEIQNEEDLDSGVIDYLNDGEYDNALDML